MLFYSVLIENNMNISNKELFFEFYEEMNYSRVWSF